MFLSMPLCNTLTSPACVKRLRKWTENTWVPTDSKYLSSFSSKLKSSITCIHSHASLLSIFLLQLGFGKSMPTTCVWLDGLSSNITEQYLTRHFCRYGHVVKVFYMTDAASSDCVFILC